MANADEQFEELYKYYRGALALLLRLGFSRDESDDLVQESFMRVYKHMDEYRGEALWAYVEKTVRRVAANSIRAKHTGKRHGEMVSDEVLATLPDTSLLLPDARLAQAEVVKRVRAAVAELKPADRAIVLLRLNGRSYEEIAEGLGLTMSAVKSRLNLARKRLKELLGDDPGLRGE
jgi:RNA polymerase sigma-70 factor (ECF subfamily)